MGFFTSEKNWSTQARRQAQHAKLKRKRQKAQVKKWKAERRKKWIGI